MSRCGPRPRGVTGWKVGVGVGERVGGGKGRAGRAGRGWGLDILNIDFVQLGPASPNPAYLPFFCPFSLLPSCSALLALLTAALLSGCLTTNTTITSPEPTRTVRSILVLGGMGQWSL